MKRILLYFIAALITLVILVFGALRFYQEPIKNAVLLQVNKQLVDAELRFDDVDLSIFSDFPNLKLSLQNVALVSTVQTDLKYLLANELSLSVNVWKYVTDKAIEVNSVGAEEIALYAWTTKNGQLSLLSFLKTDEGTVDKKETMADSTTANSAPFNLAIQKYSISINELVYVDSTSMMQVSLTGMRNAGSFSASANNYTLKNESNWQSISFSSDGVNWIDQVSGSLNIGGLVDQTNAFAKLDELKLSWNGIPLAGSGEIGFQNLDSLTMDINLETELSSLAKLITSLPVQYQAIPKAYNVSGDFSLGLTLKGLMELGKENYPAVNLAMALKNGQFKAIEEVSDLTDIFVDIAFSKPQGNINQSAVALNRLETKVGNGYLKSTASINNPFVKPKIEAKIDAKTDLSDWKVLLAAYTSDLAGELDLSVRIDTEVNDKGDAVNLDDRSLNGYLKLKDASFSSSDLPIPLQIPLIDLNFAPNAIKLNNSTFVVGNSTFSANGSLSSLMDYLTKEDGNLNGNLVINSPFIDLDELSMAFSDTTETELSIIPLPKNISFNSQATIDKLQFGEATYSNLKGNLNLKNQQLSFDAIKGNFLNGNIQLSGDYAAVDEAQATTNMSVNLKNIDLGAAGQYIQLLNKYVPIMKEASGKMEMAFSVNSAFKSGFEPDWSSLNAKGLFEAIGASVNSPAMGKLSSTLKVGDWNTLSSSKLAARFNIINGNLLVQPFTMKLAGNETNFGGEVSVNGNLKLDGDVKVPAKILNIFLTQNLNLDNNSLDKELTVPFGFTGTLTNPKLSVNTKAVTDSYKNALNTKVQENVAALRAQAKEKADKIRQAAEERIASLTTELNKNIENLAAERDNGVQSMLEAAGSNPFKKAAAELAAKKLKRESDKKIDKLKNRIQSQIESIRTTAEAEADKVLKENQQ